MSAAKPAPPGDGQARTLPAGRLRSIEDDEGSPDLSALLSRRSTAPTTTQAAVQPGDGPTDPSAVDDERDQPDTSTPTHSERPNRVRSTTVHIPAELLAGVVAVRDREGLTNGEVVLAALEHAHSRLGKLLEPPPVPGGGLFTARTTRRARPANGPLTPLNVRLYEADFTVIDDLVRQSGATSRGHLISTALSDYLEIPVTS